MADYDALKPQDIFSAHSSEIIKVSENADIANRLTQAQAHTAVDDRSALVKDGQGSLVIDQDTNMQCTFVVREGNATIANATVTNLPPLSSPHLVIGGKDASLVLDNATYQQYVDHGQGYTNAVSIGGRDGDGSLVLRNGSTLSVAHQLMLGIVSLKHLDHTNPTFSHVCGTYTDAGATQLYRDAHSADELFKNDGTSASGTHYSTGTLNVDHSEVKVGTGMTLGQAVIELDNGATLTDGAREISDSHATNVGDAVVGKTAISIRNGSTWTSNNDLWACLYGKGRTEIVVNGPGSCFESLRDTYLGYASTSATTDVQIQNQAVAQVVHADMGMYGSQAQAEAITTVSIDGTSSYNGSYLTLWSASLMSNEGQISIQDGQKNGTFRQDDPNGSPSTPKTDEQVNALMHIAGGTLVNERNGQLDAGKLDVSAGSWENRGRADIGAFSMSGGQLYHNGYMTVDSGSIDQASLTFTVGDLVQAASSTSYGWDTYSRIELSELGAGAFTLGDSAQFNILFGGDLLQSGPTETEFALDLVTGMNSDSMAALDQQSLASLASRTAFSSASPWNFEVSDYYYTADAGNLTLHGKLKVVPEPAGSVLALLAALSLAGYRRRR